MSNINQKALARWKDHPTMKTVCLDPRCPYHDSNSTMSQMFRTFLKVICESSDQQSPSEGEEDLQFPVDDVEDEPDDLEYLGDLIDVNMHDIAGDPTQLIRPECTLTDEKMLQRQGNAEVFYASLYNQEIHKTKAKDTLNDPVFVVPVVKDMADWLESVGHYHGEKKVIYLPLSVMLTYQSLCLEFKSAKNLDLPEQFTSIIENPGSNTSLHFAAGVGCAGTNFVKYKKQTKNTVNGTVDGPPYLSLGGLQSITLPSMKGDRVLPKSITGAEYKRRMSVVSTVDQTISPSFILPNSLLFGDEENKVMINSLRIMNPMVLVNRSKGTSPMHQRLIEAVKDGIKRNRTSSVVGIPFPAANFSDKRLAKIAANPILQSPSCYDPGFWYHIVTLAFGDDESLQLLVVTKKLFGGAAVCFLEQNKDKTLSFKTDNVFVWALPPIINGNKKLAKVAYSRCATGYSPTARAYFATDFLPAFVINTENSLVMCRVIAHEVFKFIDVKGCNNRLTKVHEVAGCKFKNSTQLKLYQKQVEPLMDILSRKLRLASMAPKGEFHGLHSSWIAQSNTVVGVPVLDVNMLLYSLACREKPVVIQPRVTKKIMKEPKEPKVVHNIFNVPPELKAAIYPTGFPQLVKNMDANNSANMIRDKNEGRRLSTGITHLKLQDAAQLGDTRRVSELSGRVVKLSAEERGHDTSLYDGASLLNDQKRRREFEQIGDNDLAEFVKSNLKCVDSDVEMDDDFQNIWDAVK